MNDAAEGDRDITKRYKTVRGSRSVRPTTEQDEGEWSQSYAQCPEPSGLIVPRLGCPTDYAPGTKQKYFVMLYRKGRGETLFHPWDARYIDDPRPYFFYRLCDIEREGIIYHQTVVMGQPPKRIVEDDSDTPFVACNGTGS